MEGRTLVPDERGWQECSKEEKRGWMLQVGTEELCFRIGDRA